MNDRPPNRPQVPLRKIVARNGGNLHRLAVDARIPYTTLRSWIERGRPDAVAAWERMLDAIRNAERLPSLS
jgi:hypothetical protein